MTSEGEVIANHRLVKAADAPRSYAYCSDTRYLPKLWRQIEGVSTLYHESTYLTEHIALAEKFYHSTAAQAAMVARDAHVGKLLLGHYSSRYDDEQVLLEEAQQVFNPCVLTNESDIIDV